jgi:hypothetical protein
MACLRSIPLCDEARVQKQGFAVGKIESGAAFHVFY